MLILVIVAAVVLTGEARAHDLWLEKDGAGFVLQQGHRHSAHGSSHLVEYRPESVQEALCFNSEGDRVNFQKEANSPYRITGQCAVAYVLTSSGYWTKTPYGTENVAKAQARVPIRSWLSYESVKRIDGWGTGPAKPLTKDLEITPQVNPLTLHPGNELRLLITSGGSPAAGVAVTYDDKPCGKTGTDGTINVRVRHPGFQIVQATLRRPDPTGKADEVIHTANLNFELPEK